MVDPARLERLVDAMDGELALLESLAARSDDQLRSDPIAVRAIKYSFVVTIEAAIDAAHHVISSEGLQVPESFAGAFTVLQDAGLLASELAAVMADAARFRNLLVHGYADVDDRRVLGILRTRPRDLRAFSAAIASVAGAPDPSDG